MQLSINSVRARLPLVAIAMLALLAALWAGLVRIGWGLPPLVFTLPGMHGPLMISGFLGTLISLERAVALRRPWAYLAPLLSGLGGLTIIVGAPTEIGRILITLGSIGLFVIFVVIVRHHPAIFTYMMAFGALCWVIGNALWFADWSITQLVLWWAAFLVLTVAAERLELGRLMQLSAPVQNALLLITALYAIGLLVSALVLELGIRIIGLSLIALAVWLSRFDIARRTLRQSGLTRFMATCMLSGYVWLGLGGLFALAWGSFANINQYDAILHSVFIGFIIAMIFAHGPIILPAILSRGFTYYSTFYAQLILLDLSLLLRIVGDLANSLPARQWGGLLNVIAILLFLANTVRGLRGGAKRQ